MLTQAPTELELELSLATFRNIICCRTTQLRLIESLNCWQNSTPFGCEASNIWVQRLVYSVALWLFNKVATSCWQVGDVAWCTYQTMKLYKNYGIFSCTWSYYHRERIHNYNTSSIQFPPPVNRFRTILKLGTTASMNFTLRFISTPPFQTEYCVQIYWNYSKATILLARATSLYKPYCG